MMIFQIFWDAWDIFDWARYTHKDILADSDKTEIVWSSPECVCISFTYKVSFKSKINQTVIFYSNTQRIDFKNIVFWYENKMMLGAYFPVNVRSDYFTFDVQNGILRRPGNDNTLLDQAKHEV